MLDLPRGYGEGNAAMMLSASTVVSAMGFSTNTGLPAAIAASTASVCSPSAVDTTTAVTSGWLMISRLLPEYTLAPTLSASALAFEPHRLTYYLQQLAAQLHTFYNKHRILPPAVDQESGETPVAEEISPRTTAARLVLMRSVQQVVKNGLNVLGIAAPEQM